MDDLLVSVLMTAYNREDYIEEAIESVLGSSYSNFELIIVDDCSKDNTVIIARKFEQKDQRISVYVNDKNLGDYPNRNKAASYANGYYLMYVDSDDKILPDGIEKCVAAMRQFPACGFGIYSPERREPFLLGSESALRKHFFEKIFLQIGPGGTIIKKDFFEHIKRYPEKYGPANDNYFNLKACSAGDIVMLPFEFVFYRIHEGQEINNLYSYLINNYTYMKDALEKLPLKLGEKEIEWLAKKNKRRFFVNIVKYFLKTRNVNKTLKALRLSSFKLSDTYQALFQ